jgi:hypothetical protein
MMLENISIILQQQFIPEHFISLYHYPLQQPPHSHPLHAIHSSAGQPHHAHTHTHTHPIQEHHHQVAMNILSHCKTHFLAILYDTSPAPNTIPSTTNTASMSMIASATTPVSLLSTMTLTQYPPHYHREMMHLPYQHQSKRALQSYTRSLSKKIFYAWKESLLVSEDDSTL